MRRILCLCFIFFSLNCFAQNLVQNPSFEEHSICPNNPDQLSNCLYWTSFRETPDYFNECGQISGFNIVPPNCFSGFQYPHSGNAFAGFCTFYYDIFYREIIGNQLLLPLVFKQKYYISFYVNLGGSIYSHTTIATNKIGIKLSSVPYSYNNPTPINNTAHFYCNNIIPDTLGWTKIFGSFVADSAYTYLMIGNFFTDSLTDTLNLFPTDNQYAYYFIDDICVSTDSLYCENWTGITQSESWKEEITIYPNPCINQLTVQLNKELYEPATLSLLDITGKTIMQTQTTENEYIFDTEKLAKGLYLVKVETGGRVALTKFTKE